MSKIYYYQKLGNSIYYIKEDTKKQKIYKTSLNDEGFYNNNHYFEMTKGYTCLFEYKDDFKRHTSQLHMHLSLKFRYYEAYNHQGAIMRIYKSIETINLRNYTIEKVNYKEFNMIERCNNSGLMTFDNDYKGKTTNCFGYDYSAYYPNLLATFDLKMPIKQGISKKIDYIDYDNIQYGMYHVKITSDNKQFKKIWTNSKFNYYTHYSIIFAHKYREMFNIKIELIKDDDDNCTVYPEEYLIKTKKIFSRWFESLNKVKTLYPDNRLCKYVMSSLWGRLIQYNRIQCNNETIRNYSDISQKYDKIHTRYKLIHEKLYKDDEIYQIIDTENPYKHELARMKPFLTSYGRTNVGELCISENILNDVVRIHTDGIILTKEHDFKHLKYYPKPEGKHTCNIILNNVMSCNKEDEDEDEDEICTVCTCDKCKKYFNRYFTNEFKN